MPFLKQFFIYFIILIGYSAYTQNINLDSLFTELKVKPNTIKKVDALIDLYKKSVRQHELRKDFIDEALLVAEDINYMKGIGVCYNRKGLTARHEQDFSQSVMFHKRALTFFEKAKDTFYVAKCLNNLGVTYRKLNLEKEAFENYFKALKLAEKIDNKKGITIALNGIGNVFLNTEQYDKALYYLKKALIIETEVKNLRGQEYGSANVGEVFLHKKQYDSAYYYFDKSLKLSLKNSRKESVAIKYTLFGLLYQSKAEYQKSIDFYKKAIPDLKANNNTRYLSKCLIRIGINQLHLKQYDKGYKNIMDGLRSAKKIKSKENITLGYEALVAYYSQTNQYKQALEAHKKAKIFHDSIVNEASQRSIISTQIAYETQEKDKTITTLAQEKETNKELAKTNWLRFIIAVLLGVFGIGILLILQYLYRKNSDLELQQKNSDLKNYLFQISELKNQAKTKKPNAANFKERLKEFNLSNREMEVLIHISNGFNNDEIAEKMFVSKNTIKTHITHIYSKLDVRNRVQAIQKMITH